MSKKKYIKAILLIISLVWTCQISYAQNFLIEKITSNGGLPQNDVNTIFQDSDGFLWIGTNDGLTRYDGYSFKTFYQITDQKNGLKSNLIYQIDEDNNKNLWIGTSDNGVFRFNLETEKFDAFHNTDENSDLLSSNQVVCMLVAKNGSVWLGSKYGKLDILSFKNDSLTVDKMDIDQHVVAIDKSITAIAQDYYGRIWVSTKYGIFVFKGDESHEFLGKFGPNGYVKDLYITDKAVYAAYKSAILYKFKIEEKIKEPEVYSFDQHYNINKICVTSDHSLLLGTTEGLYIFDSNKLSTGRLTDPVYYKDGLSSSDLGHKNVSYLFEDHSGIIWIGTYGGGLNKLNLKQKKFLHYTKKTVSGSLSGNKIRTIFEDRNQNLWIGTEGGGVNFLSRASKSNYESGFISLDVNPTTGQNNVYSFIDLNKTGNVEIVAGCGYPNVIEQIEAKNNKLTATVPEFLRGVQNQPMFMINDRNGNVWIGTYGYYGLYVIRKNGNDKRLINIRSNDKPGGLSSNNIRSFLEDSHGNIWIGTDNGLNLLTPDQQENNDPQFIVFKNDYSISNSISHNYILPIFQSKKGTIWVGTMGGGLNKMKYSSNPDSINFTSYSTSNGLPNNTIKGILEDDYGSLWISSNKGLTRFDVKNDVLVDFNVSDGIQSYEFGELACCKRKNGELVFGGVNGINVFKPTEIIIDMVAPKVALTDFQILDQSVKVGEKYKGHVILKKGINYTQKIKLRYAENSFAIYYASLHFSSPSNNKYKYILEGFDKEWIRTNSNERFAKYTNLSPGKYTFKVLSSNNDGIWSYYPKVIEIIIVPPWWRSKLAFVLYGLLLLLLILFFQRYSLIKIRRKNELLMEHFEKEKIEELSQIKLRFFTNISHEFRTPLTLIIGPLDKLIKQWDKLPSQQVIKNFSVMKRNATVLLNLINQLVDFQKMEQGKMKLNVSYRDVVPLMREMYLSFIELAENKNIEYVFTTKFDPLPLWFDENIIERTMYNLLSNAFKYTPKNGRIEVILEQDDDNVILFVQDDGIGIPEEMQQHIFERFYQATRINSSMKSTGIGLSFIKGLIELHKGEIYFDSEENKGTTFTVKLPKGNAHLMEEQMKPQVVKEHSPKKRGEIDLIDLSADLPEEAEENQETGNPKLLVIEDNFELADFIANNLAGRYNVATAENGKSGLEKVYKFNPDIIISDVMMPIMSGFEVCKAIKEDENICHKIVILLTAKSDEESKIEGYNAGADAYISKPFSIDILETRIKNLLQTRTMLKEKLKSTLTVIPSEVTSTSIDEKFLKRVLNIVEENISDSSFTVEKLASDYGTSKFNLNKKLKELTGNTANAFIREIRLNRAAQLLSTGRYSVTDVTYEVGFTDLKYFRNCFKKAFSLSPSDYIRESRDEQ